MPVEVEELAKYGNGAAILGEDDEPTQISVQISGVVHQKDNGQPQGAVDEEAHDKRTADEAVNNDVQSQISTENKNESQFLVGFEQNVLKQRRQSTIMMDL